MYIPQELIFDGSSIEILFVDEISLNRTAAAVVIEGTRPGFLSLSNCLIFLVNSLEDDIDLSQLPFVKPYIPLYIQIDETVEDHENGIIAKRDESSYIWKLSEAGSNSVFTSIHSLAHVNSEIHFDHERMPSDQISVYCGVKE